VVEICAHAQTREIETLAASVPHPRGRPLDAETQQPCATQRGMLEHGDTEDATMADHSACQMVDRRRPRHRSPVPRIQGRRPVGAELLLPGLSGWRVLPL